MRIDATRYRSLATLAGPERLPLTLGEGATVADALAALGADPDRWTALRNGRVVADARAEPLRDGDEVVLGRTPEDPGTVILAVIAVASAVASYMLMPRPPGAAQEGERPYGFARFSRDALAGETVPVCFGRRTREGGRVVASVPREGPDARSRLRMLICLGHGRLHAIGDQNDDFDNLGVGAGGLTGLYINDQPAENLEGVRVWGRMGHAAQQIIPGFSDTETVHEVGAGGAELRNTSGAERTGAEPSGEAAVYTTTGGVDAAELRIRFPQGLYRAASKPRLRAVQARWRWKLDSGSSWSAWVVETFSERQQGAFTVSRRIEGLDPGDGALNIQVERVSVEEAGIAFIDAMTWDAVVEILHTENDFVYAQGGGGYAMLALEIPASEQISQQPRVSVEVEGVRTLVWDGVSAGDAADPFEAERGYTANPAAALLEAATNPVWGLKAQMGIERVDLDSLFAWWAWCDEEVDRYDGAGETRPRFRFSATLGSRRDGWDLIRAICAAGRAVPVMLGSTLRVVMIRAQEAPVERFTEGSIVGPALDGDSGGDRGPVYTRELATGGFTRANQVVAQFESEANDGDVDSVAWPRDGELWLGGATPETPNTERVFLEGVTDPDQARAEVKHMMQRLRAEQVRFEFATTKPFVRVQPGERFDVAWTMPGWGSASGRLRPESDDGELVVDEVIEDIGGLSVAVVRGDDTAEVVGVTSVTRVDGVTRIELAETLSEAPAPWAEYIIGLPASRERAFILESLELADPRSRVWRLRGVEYVESVHDDTPDGPLDRPSPSPPLGPGIPPGPVSALLAALEPGAERPRVRLTWRQTPRDAAHTAWFAVYRREVGETRFDADPIRVASANTLLLDIATGIEEEYAVVAVALDGAQISPNAAAVVTASLTIDDAEEAPPPDLGDDLAAPGNVDVTAEADGSHTLSWDPVAGASRYRVEVCHTDDDPIGDAIGALAHFVASVPDPTTTLAGLHPGFGQVGEPTSLTRYRVRAVNPQGRVGRAAGTALAFGELIGTEAVLAIEAHDIETEGETVNLTWDSALGALVPSDPALPSQYTGPVVEIPGGPRAVKLRAQVVVQQLIQGITLAEASTRTPTPETDLWRVGDHADRPLVMAAAPEPAAAVEVRVFVSVSTGAGFGPYQEVGLQQQLSATASQMRWRVELRRNRFPYALGLQTLRVGAAGE